MLRTVCSARAGFTRADLAFIESLHDPSVAVAIRSLVKDPDCLQQIMDQPGLRKALLEAPVALPVSPSLYFYTLVRHSLLESGIDHVGLADHIAGVLVEKLGRAGYQGDKVPSWATHVVDFVALIQNASGLLKVHLEVAAGDQFLVLTGLFPEFLNERSNRYGAPGADFYSSFGQQSYQRAATNRHLTRESQQLFSLLAEVFPLACRSLLQMRDHCLFLGE